MNILKMFFGGNFLGRKADEYRRNASAGIRRGTVGRARAAASEKMMDVDRKVFSAQNKAINKSLRMGNQNQQQPGSANVGAPGGDKKQQAKGGKGGKGGGNAQKGNMPKPKQGKRPNPNGKMTPQQQQQQMMMRGGGPPGRAAMPNGRAPMPNTGRHNPVPQRPPGGQQPSGGFVNYGGGPSGGGGDERTQAIDIRGLEKEAQRQVVGWIVAQSGNHKGQDFRLYDGKNVVGTAANCDIVVTDPYLSARHCTIRYDNGNFVVIDLDSRNGTYVNQKRISKEDLIDNDTVRLGKSEFKFKSLF